MSPVTARSVSGLSLAEAVELADRLTALVALLDEEGRILAVNRAWKAFAAAHGAAPERTGVGADYLAVCEQAASELDADAARFGAGLRAVLAGEAESFEHETRVVVDGCAVPWRARVTRLVEPTRTSLMVTHERRADGPRSACPPSS